MREIFEGTSVIKYQQPDEDLDALVSVVNDDDVMNMMEEYDKLGSAGDGFTRLRIFLFSQLLDADTAAITGFDGDERGTERRYVDALNNLMDAKSQLSPLEFADHFLSQSGLHHINIPHHPHAQRYGEVDSSWSPAFFSPRHDLRDVPGSPSSVRYHHHGTGEFSDYNPTHLEHQSPTVIDNMVWLPPGAIIQENSGFPGNLGYNHSGYEGTAICEQCHIGFHRSQASFSNARYSDPHWKHGLPRCDHSNACAECYSCGDPYAFSHDVKFDHAVFMKDAQGLDRSWIHHPLHNNVRFGDPRVHWPPPSRIGENYAFDANVVSANFGRGTFSEGNEVFAAQQAVGAIHQMQISGIEENGIQFGNHPSIYGADNFHQFQHNLPPLHLRGKEQAALGIGTSYELPGLMVQNGTGSSAPMFDFQDVSPQPSGHGLDVQTQIPLPASGNLAQRSAAPEYLVECGVRDNTNVFPGGIAEDACPQMVSPSIPISNKLASNYVSKGDVDEHARVSGQIENFLMLSEKRTGTTAIGDPNLQTTGENVDIRVESSEFVPELINLVNRTTLEEAEDIRSRADSHSDTSADVLTVHNSNEPPSNELEPGNVQVQWDAESDGDVKSNNSSKIEPTTAEAEALAKGLQTIHNDDLEEIRELGSGTYGAVYHGKWRGSDVAIKRIKASCFAGKPSERERLIADFWKEALILSSLHHPNVVSFYGVVRDGPDGSLATVTEFMVNGSLKQFLQKKDRTIDRRKRLIIAMDVAFGMEYLHAKNIVHFDLKCENLLVNMRDPHRPVCKIGDLGLSKVKQHTLVSGGIRGTLPWMAPELLSGKTSMVSEKIDVYSFGGIVNSTLRPQIPSWCDPEWRSLMESCWSTDPTERPSFSEISQKLRKMAAAMNLK
ncbi:hypothetical protein HPP92_014847 [Vanilla planifolia]|uniref:Protein kinase domain-containing protein n=1 Tax=Vanilla planifolia TaxID=51239 RepID=A0A835QKS6_VANPL|nr:hypothetical protein HPP92_014847 [Vanilla planifolia]